jgi:hypothetical protein
MPYISAPLLQSHKEKDVMQVLSRAIADLVSYFTSHRIYTTGGHFQRPSAVCFSTSLSHLYLGSAYDNRYATNIAGYDMCTHLFSTYSNFHNVNPMYK